MKDIHIDFLIDFSVSVPCNPGYFKFPSGVCERCPDGSYQTHGYHSNCIQCANTTGYSTGGPGASYHELCGKSQFHILCTHNLCNVSIRQLPACIFILILFAVWKQAIHPKLHCYSWHRCGSITFVAI